MDIIEPEKKQEFESVLPLINIVFLLLIFFMLTGALTKPDMFSVVVPEATMDSHANRGDMTILMNADGELAIATTRYSESQLVDLIKRRLEDKKTTVQLKADENVKSQDLITFMETLSTHLGSAGLQSIRLVTVASSDTSTQHILH
ncbi:MAG: biopolymer transport protein ExbD [Cellvibrionaceae bacterium]|jgi:biopolymer transport protein ExbD